MFIESERLLLKNYSPEHYADFASLFTDEKVMKFVDEGVYSIEKAEMIWKKLFEEFYANDLKTIFGVFTKEDLRHIGHASIRPRPTQKDEWEIVYLLRQTEWNKGYATEIATALVDFGLKALHLNAVFATVDEDNLASIKVLKKSGFKFKEHEFDEQGRYSLYSTKPSQN
jgi:[ribosomal protein S5]-alanine N-acetyltransferase